MAALAPAPIFYEHDANGDPLALGKVYTYASGSSTPLATYTDAGGGTANANPVILDSAGRANIWLLSSSLYRFEVYSSTNVLQYGPIDNIGASVGLTDLANTASASLGDALVGVKSTLTGGTARTQHTKNLDTVSVKDFGAVGDGSTNDYAAIQAAINAVVAAGPGLLHFPAGTYKCNTGLTLNVSKCRLVGDYATINFSSLSSSGTGITVTGDASGDAFENSPGGIEGINLAGPGDVSTANALYFHSATEAGPSYTSYRDMYISGWNNAVYFGNNSYLIDFDNVNMRVGGACINHPAATNSGERIALSNCTLSGANYGIILEDSDADFVLSNTSLDTATTAIYIRGSEISLHGCHIECTGNALDSLSSGGTNARVTFSGTRMIQTTSGGATPFLYAKADTYLTIIGGSINPHASTVTSISMSANSRLSLLGTFLNYSGTVDAYNGCARSFWVGGGNSILNASEVAATSLSSSGTSTLGANASALVGFHSATGVVQAAAIPSVGATGIASGLVGFATTAQAQTYVDAINSILTALRNKGLIAT